MDPKKPPKKMVMQINLDPKIAQGSYANMALINNSENEFIFDFLFVQPQMPTASVSNRIVISPRQAKRFNQLLTNALARYEEKFGPVQTTDSGSDETPPLTFLH